MNLSFLTLYVRSQVLDSIQLDYGASHERCTIKVPGTEGSVALFPSAVLGDDTVDAFVADTDADGKMDDGVVSGMVETDVAEEVVSTEDVVSSVVDTDADAEVDAVIISGVVVVSRDVLSISTKLDVEVTMSMVAEVVIPLVVPDTDVLDVSTKLDVEAGVSVVTEVVDVILVEVEGKLVKLSVVPDEPVVVLDASAAVVDVDAPAVDSVDVLALVDDALGFDDVVLVGDADVVDDAILVDETEVVVDAVLVDASEVVDMEVVPCEEVVGTVVLCPGLVVDVLGCTVVVLAGCWVVDAVGVVMADVGMGDGATVEVERVVGASGKPMKK